MQLPDIQGAIFSPLIPNMPESQPDRDIPDPVTFAATGLEPDVRIEVFGQVFHTHSEILKLHSAYFRTLLDSADKSHATKPRPLRYNFLATDLSDGRWGFEVASKDLPQKCWKTPYSKQIVEEREAFAKLLFAFYNKTYTITSFREFVSMVRLADFYSTLPTLCASLYAALWNSPGLIHDISTNCKLMLILAQKLRHPILFREALVHVVSQWSGPNDFFDGHYKIVCVITAAHNRICERLLAANQELLCAMSYAEVLQAFKMTQKSLLRTATPTQNAPFYRTLYALLEKVPERGLDKLKADISSLLENKLVLDRVTNRGGYEVHSRGFLCARIEDKELPWKLEE